MIGIITAVTTERDAVLEKMDRIQMSKIYDLEYFEGKINHTPCIMVMSGVGKVNAARCTQLLIDRFNPERIVNIGSAGALHPDLNIGDVVISTACVQYDINLTAFGIKKGSLSKEHDGFFEADQPFAALCEKAMEKSISDEFKIILGPIATGDRFNDSVERKEKIFKEFGALCNEMEGAAVAQVCALCNIPFVVIRSISDNSDEGTLMMYNEFKKLASKRCANFLVNLVNVLEEESLTNCIPIE